MTASDIVKMEERITELERAVDILIKYGKMAEERFKLQLEYNEICNKHMSNMKEYIDLVCPRKIEEEKDGD